ncbi:hypothetical protein HK104_000785 [Borealophlyctis nickersoniae]|nr:hypothetical protein HK104_000785 [Borealophlyctis nickersoniae]
MHELVAKDAILTIARVVAHHGPRNDFPTPAPISTASQLHLNLQNLLLQAVVLKDGRNGEREDRTWKETNGDRVEKRGRRKRRRKEEEEGGADGELEGNKEAGSAHAQKKRKKRKAAKRPTLLRVCNAEIDILRSIVGYIRSRFDYLRLGFTCKQLYNTIIQTPIHHHWFTQYMNEGWFSTFDDESEVDGKHPIRNMAINDSRAVRCNFRNVEMVSDFCNMDDESESGYSLTQLLVG